MAIRILQSNVSDFVRDTLLNVRTGLEAALAQGIVVELPEKMDFQLEIIEDGLTNNTVTTTSGSDVNPSLTETTVEGSSTDTESDSRTATQGTANSGDNTTDTVTTYSSKTT